MKSTNTRIVVFFTLLMCILGALTACGTPAEDKTYDDAFLNDLKKGLMARWDLVQGADEPEDAYCNKLVDSELDVIKDYTNKKFKDSLLQERAISYINLLNKQKEALTYFSADTEKWNELWQDAYKKRTQAVREFIKEYDLKFPDKYKDIISEFENSAKVADENDKLKTDVQTMLDNLKFEKVKEEYKYKYYEAVIENITDKTFDNFSVNVNLVDADGVIVESKYTNTNDFAPGRKAKLEFSTDKDFKTMEFKADYN